MNKKILIRVGIVLLLLLVICTAALIIPNYQSLNRSQVHMKVLRGQLLEYKLACNEYPKSLDHLLQGGAVGCPHFIPGLVPASLLDSNGKQFTYTTDGDHFSLSSSAPDIYEANEIDEPFKK